MAEVEDTQIKIEGEVNNEGRQEKGIDVSQWQGKIDWGKVAKTGIKHVYIKMSEGGSHVDPKFVENWNGAKKVGLKINCYHYFKALGCTPQQQIQNIIQYTKAVGFDPAKNALAIDVEIARNENATPVQMADNLKALLNLIKKDAVLSYSKTMIYTSYWSWESKVKWDKYNFAIYPLWVAHCGVQAPRLPQPWRNAGKTWSWWQYSFKGKVDGICTNVDMDWVKA